jgi:hypothetical protein
MPEDKISASGTRPRLLSDILEIPVSESAIPEEYTMHRPSSSPAPQVSGRRHGQSGLHHHHFGSYQQPKASNSPAITSAPDPGIIGQPQQWISSSNTMSHVARLQPLTSLTPQMPHRYNENRRSTPNPLLVFTTSPAVSDTGSPSHSRFPSLERSLSQTSLNARRYPSRPRTPTPSHGAKGNGRSAPRSSSLPSSPKSRRSTPHPHGKPSVKHLTCFWWKVKGDCRFSEEDCLYAHFDTGLQADPPRQVTPGGENVRVHSCSCTEFPSASLEPAKAGRHLEKALENLRSRRNPSSSSLNTSLLANPSTPESQGMCSYATTPADTEDFHERISSLQSDNSFLRNLVERGSEEKAVLVTTIEGLQKENSSAFSDALPLSRANPEKTADMLGRS